MLPLFLLPHPLFLSWCPLGFFTRSTFLQEFLFSRFISYARRVQNSLPIAFIMRLFTLKFYAPSFSLTDLSPSTPLRFFEPSDSTLVGQIFKYLDIEIYGSSVEKEYPYRNCKSTDIFRIHPCTPILFCSDFLLLPPHLLSPLAVTSKSFRTCVGRRATGVRLVGDRSSEEKFQHRRTIQRGH